MTYEQAEYLKGELLKNSAFIKDNYPLREQGWDLQIVIVPNLTLDFLEFLSKISVSTTVSNKVQDSDSKVFSRNNEFTLVTYHWAENKLLYKLINFSLYID